MAIFSKNDNTQNYNGQHNNHQASSETTVIAHGAAIKGEFAFECRLHVDGELEGTINSSNLIVIGRRGIVKGELRAQKLVVNGVFEGSADCNEVEVLAGGVFCGDVVSEELSIEAKAKFQGQSKLRDVDSQQGSNAIPVIDSNDNDEEFNFSYDKDEENKEA